MAQTYELRPPSDLAPFSSIDVAAKTNQGCQKRSVYEKPTALLASQNGFTFAHFTAIASPATELQELVREDFETAAESQTTKRWPLAYGLIFATATSFILWYGIFKLANLALG
jgi:hypothetical protein